MNDDTEVRDFRVQLTGSHDIDDWNSDEETKYHFLVGTAGELMIFRSKFNAQFGAALKTDQRWYLYAPGTWQSVEVLEEGDLS